MYSHPTKNVLIVKHTICYKSIILKGKEALLIYIIETRYVGALRMYSPPPFEKICTNCPSKYEGAYLHSWVTVRAKVDDIIQLVYVFDNNIYF